MMNPFPQSYVKQMISFQKTTFENSFKAMDKLQQQAENMFTSACQQTSWLPEEGKAMLTHWVGALQEGRKSFHHTVREGFDRIEGNLTKEGVPDAKETVRTLNELTRQELEEIIGIGEATAEKIIHFRDKNGPFKKWEDVQKNIGISTVTLARMQKEFTL